MDKYRVKGKGRYSGFIRHCGFVKPIVPSPLGLPSFITRGAVYQPDTQRTLLAEEGTYGILPAISEFTKRVGFFNMPQSWDMGQILLLPKEGMLWIFTAGKIRRLRSGAKPRSWVPEASMLTPRPPKRNLCSCTICTSVEKQSCKLHRDCCVGEVRMSLIDIWVVALRVFPTVVRIFLCVCIYHCGLKIP
jgi:hypothetical protein